MRQLYDLTNPGFSKAKAREGRYLWLQLMGKSETHRHMVGSSLTVTVGDRFSVTFDRHMTDEDGDEYTIPVHTIFGGEEDSFHDDQRFYSWFYNKFRKWDFELGVDTLPDIDMDIFTKPYTPQENVSSNGVDSNKS